MLIALECVHIYLLFYTMVSGKGIVKVVTCHVYTTVWCLAIMYGSKSDGKDRQSLRATLLAVQYFVY